MSASGRVFLFKIFIYVHWVQVSGLGTDLMTLDSVNHYPISLSGKRQHEHSAKYILVMYVPWKEVWNNIRLSI